jgi:integrase
VGRGCCRACWSELWALDDQAARHHAGLPLKDLQKILGHKSLVTTELYLAESDLKTAHMRAFADKAFSFW